MAKVSKTQRACQVVVLASTPPTPVDPSDAFRRMATAIANSQPLKSLDDLRQIPRRVRELVLDRIDAGFREGLFEITCEAYAGLLMCIMPDEFVIPPEPPQTTDTPPGSGGKTNHHSARVKVYMQRCRKAVSLWHRQDAKGDQHKRGIQPLWEGGEEAKTGGWQDETGLHKLNGLFATPT